PRGADFSFWGAAGRWRDAAAGPGSGFFGGRHVACRLLGTAAEQELLHFLFEEGAVLRIARRQPVLVDQHGLVRKPGGPCGLADAGVDALAQFAGPGDEIQALGLALFVLAEDRAGHGLWSLHSESSSLRMGAGRPKPASSARATQRWASLSPTRASGATLRSRSGCRCRR